MSTGVPSLRRTANRRVLGVLLHNSSTRSCPALPYSMIASLRLHGERGMPGIEWAIIGAITGSGIPSSMVAQNVGAGRRERVAAIARAGVLYSFLLTGASVLAVEI